MKRWKKAVLAAGVLLVVFVAVFAFLCWQGLLLLPNKTEPNRWETENLERTTPSGAQSVTPEVSEPLPSEVTLAELETRDWEEEAQDIFDRLKKNAYPGLAEYGLDLDKMEEDFYTYVEAQSALDAYIACGDDPTVDIEAEGQRARAAHYEDFVRGMRDVENFGTGSEPESREVTLDNPIDDWTAKWLYLDGMTGAMVEDGHTEMQIWEAEVTHTYKVLNERVGAVDGLDEKVQTAQKALLDFAPAYGECVALYQFSNAFGDPESWEENPENPISSGTLARSERFAVAADYYRREVLTLWERLGVENATWVFEPSAYEAALKERYQQIYGKDISEFQLLLEEARS